MLLFLDQTVPTGEKYPIADGKNPAASGDFSPENFAGLRSGLQDIQAAKYLYYPDSPNWNDEWDINTYLKRIQQGADPGERIAAAFADAFEEGHQRVIWISPDCPGLTAEMVREAAASLEAYDVVIGPSAGGAYYLLGLKEPHPGLFANLPWSNGDVLAQTKYILQEMGLSYEQLPELQYRLAGSL